MGCTRICLDKKSDILNYVYSISNDIMINNLISDLINRDGVTNFFCNDDGSYGFSLVTDNHERVYILFNDSSIFVSNNIDGIRQRVYYKITDDYKYVSINNFSSIQSHDNCIDRTVSFEKKCDCHDNLIFESKVVEINDLKDGSSCSTISKYVIDGVSVRVNSVSYDNNPDIDVVNYYIFDGSSWISISESEFNSRFIDKINEKGLQKKKSMV